MTMSSAERGALLVRYRDGAAEFEAAVADVAPAELDAHPIAGEWSVREIAHHLADGELNSAIRLRRRPFVPNTRRAASRSCWRRSLGRVRAIGCAGYS